MHVVLIVIPAVFAALCYAVPRERFRMALFLAGSLAHFATIAVSWSPAFQSQPDLFFEIEPLGHLFITLISLLFLATSVCFIGYRKETNASERVFIACMLALLAALSAVCMSRNLGVLWVSMEAASLAVTPLIYFRISARSLEATWKFLLMNSVGIALALLGIFCIAVSTLGIAPEVSLSVNDLVTRAHELDVAWLRSGFLLILVGFGTKMGLSPLHSWKPDAYGEAPPPVAALLSGGVTLGAFIGILRVYQVCAAADLADFASKWLVAFGLLSIATAAVFVVNNNDYRRILAYTSVEHMGVMVIGVGLGAAGSYASMLHAMHNTLNKGVLFFVAGFFWRLYESNRVNDVRGALHRHPVAALLLLGGLCATSGLPPFGMFYSELAILFAAAANAQWWVVAMFVATLCTVFVGVMTAMLPMIFGPPPEKTDSEAAAQAPWRNTAMLAPAVVLLVLAFSVGVYQPPAIRNALVQAAQTLSPDTASGAPTLAKSVNRGQR